MQNDTRQIKLMPKVELWQDPDDGLCLGYEDRAAGWIIVAKQIEPKFAQLLLVTMQRYFAEEANR